jgi:hypothetical protein
MKHLSEDQLILFHYGESDTQDADKRHLDDCSSCRSELKALQRTLSEVVPDPVPERPDDYGQRVWRRIEDDLKTPSPRWSWLELFRPRQLAWAAAAATLLAAVFFAGRLSTRWGVEPETPSTAQVREGILLVALGDHLDSSQILLMEIANTPGADNGAPQTVDISYERRLAEDLVGKNRLYRQTADRIGDKATALVLDELERMLLDIAHSPEEVDWTEFDDLRRRIEKHGVLFKVKVLNTNVKQRQLERATQKKL